MGRKKQAPEMPAPRMTVAVLDRAGVLKAVREVEVDEVPATRAEQWVPVEPETAAWIRPKAGRVVWDGALFQPRRRAVARLDHRGVLQGCAEQDWDAPVEPFTVALPDGHDMHEKAGRYRWIDDPANPMGGAFHPLARPGTPERAAETLAERPEILAAIAKGFLAIRDGRPLPTATLDWLAEFEKSIDAK